MLFRESEAVKHLLCLGFELWIVQCIEFGLSLVVLDAIALTGFLQLTKGRLQRWDRANTASGYFHFEGTWMAPAAFEMMMSPP